MQQRVLYITNFGRLAKSNPRHLRIDLRFPASLDHSLECSIDLQVGRHGDSKLVPRGTGQYLQYYAFE